MMTTMFTALREMDSDEMNSEGMSDALVERPTALLVRVTRDGRTEQAYLLHWRSPAETLAAFAQLPGAGALRNIELIDLGETGDTVTGRGLLSSFDRHGIQFDRPPRGPGHSRPIAERSPAAEGRRRDFAQMPEPAGWPGHAQAPGAVPWLLGADGLTAIPASPAMA
jgi:hypothetical protein